MSQLDPMLVAVRSGVYRGWTEFKKSLVAPQDIGYYVVTGLIMLGVLLFQRDRNYGETTLTLAALSLPSLLGMLIAFNNVIGPAAMLGIEREDGTLLRAKAVPNGMVGYLVGMLTVTPLSTVVSLLVIFLPGLFLVDGLLSIGIGGWLTFLAVLVLGMLATMPWGAILGSLFRNPRLGSNIIMLPTMGLVGISGIFYPIVALWEWLQWVAQVFPMYWLGLGMRSAFLPDSAAAVEIGGSWRTWQTFAVLSAWAVAGLLVAPGVLRKMARKESGAAVAARRQIAMQRTY